MSAVKKFKRKLNGEVVSDKNTKTIVVSVARRFKHPIYNKFVSKTKKYHAHDEAGTAKLGDKVTIIESRPYSKLKKWELFKVN
ncbi:30S ribosomal protein S17 [Bacteriovorax sp. BSW11_IV]|uniref:30S ribosomal protein S17 n=1 Tax=Bacteriovorax sp. BSW11_IV TaxID=1353529 RepID=UPI000389EC84|nr:30S ribosomal protein S17 [Bacteriovorax sp. BSW11_IV]EQC48811.1 30S ribosomal protein S17 [Bacteriovorax sp. BSW11_IV]